MRSSFRYRLLPTRRQAKRLGATLDECRWLCNHLLAQRKTAYEERREVLGRYYQQATLPALKAERPALDTVHSQVLQNVAVRLDLAFQAFFRRVKAGQTPGYPRFRGEGWYDSFTYPQRGFALEGERVVLSKIGQVKLVRHRPIRGHPKTCTISRSRTGKWYVAFACTDVPADEIASSEEAVGIDVGLASFATLSTGEQVANPCFFRADERALRRAQRRLSREQRHAPQRARRQPL